MDVIFTAILGKDTHISVNDNLVQLIVDQKLVNKMLKKKKLRERERERYHNPNPNTHKCICYINIKNVPFTCISVSMLRYITALLHLFELCSGVNLN